MIQTNDLCSIIQLTLFTGPDQRLDTARSLVLLLPGRRSHHAPQLPGTTVGYSDSRRYCWPRTIVPEPLCSYVDRKRPVSALSNLNLDENRICIKMKVPTMGHR